MGSELHSDDVRAAFAQLKKLEERISRIEEELELVPARAESQPLDVQEPIPKAQDEEEELEFRLGQNWFAKVGIVVLAIGMAFLLTQPFEELPSGVPVLIGAALVGVLFGLSRLWKESYALIAGYLRGAAMALLYFTTLRLFFFSADPLLETTSVSGMVLLVAVSSANILLALRRKSHYLLGLALTMAYATAIVVGTAWFVLGLLPILAAFVAVVRVRMGASGVMMTGIVLTLLTHMVWALNNPIIGNPLEFVTTPQVNIYVLLAYALIFALGILRRTDHPQEDFAVAFTTFLSAGGSYGLFLLLTVVTFDAGFVLSHLAASILFLSLAIVFWTREQSKYSTFVYAMLGYMALSVAIVKEFAVPNVFVWLSVQSIVVVATAVWFRSRFIVVANFGIYLAIIVGYLVVATEETGISVGFGIVALASARILNWQKDRLELKTELMRNAYLGAAFAVFPYALYFLIPTEYVWLSWIGLAIFYYGMNALIQAQKYRWMGHLTLLLTVLYVVVVGIIELPPTYRIVSFLVLAVVLLAVSMVFTRLRAKRKDKERDGAPRNRPEE
jgi:uncharacterized membrane protein